MSETPVPQHEPARPRRPRGASVAELASALGAAPHDPGDDALRLTGVTLDSRSVEPGDLWSALPGQVTHGARFAAQAVERGAALALTDEDGSALCADAGLPALVVPDPRAATATAAALVQGRPAERLATVGVTGTNGKTSITTAVTRTLLALDVPAGVVGTSGTKIGRAHV